MSTTPPLFDDLRPPETLPFQGTTPEARHAGATAASHASARRPALAHRYLELLLRRGAHGATDHEASAVLRCPVSSICSTRAGQTVHPQITSHGHRRGPYAELNCVWVLRVVVGQRFDSPVAEAQS